MSDISKISAKLKADTQCLSKSIQEGSCVARDVALDMVARMGATEFTRGDDDQACPIEVADNSDLEGLCTYALENELEWLEAQGISDDVEDAALVLWLADCMGFANGGDPFNQKSEQEGEPV